MQCTTMMFCVFAHSRNDCATARTDCPSFGCEAMMNLWKSRRRSAVREAGTASGEQGLRASRMIGGAWCILIYLA